MLVVKAEAPTRIDLAGGTLDIHPLYHVLERPQTVNIGISLSAEVVVQQRQDRTISLRSQDLQKEIDGTYDQLISNQELPLLGLILKEFWRESWGGLQIDTKCKSPAGAGLGGSSCLAVTLAAALNCLSYELKLSDKLSESDLIQRVQNTETRLIHCPTGCQDYWGAARGRVNILSFDSAGVSVSTVSPDYIDYLDERLVICYSGKSRASGVNNWSIFRAVFDGDQTLRDKLNQIADISGKVAGAIVKNNWTDALSHSQREWNLRKSLWPEIETDETRRIDSAAVAAGASFSRVCGAGGGGVMAIFTEAAHRSEVIAAAQEAGGSILDAKVSRRGLIVSCEAV